MVHGGPFRPRPMRHLGRHGGHAAVPAAGLLPGLPDSLLPASLAFANPLKLRRLLDGQGSMMSAEDIVGGRASWASPAPGAGAPGCAWSWSTGEPGLARLWQCRASGDRAGVSDCRPVHHQALAAMLMDPMAAAPGLESASRAAVVHPPAAESASGAISAQRGACALNECSLARGNGCCVRSIVRTCSGKRARSWSTSVRTRAAVEGCWRACAIRVCRRITGTRPRWARRRP